VQQVQTFVQQRAGKEFWVQTGTKTVQRAGKEFWVQTGTKTVQRARNELWVQTETKTVQTMDELEIPKVREDVKQNNPITMDSDYETSLETSGELILSSGNFHLSIWPDFAARSVP